MGRDEDAHVVKQPDGVTDADIVVHFEHAGVLYLGSFTSDGFPTSTWRRAVRWAG